MDLFFAVLELTFALIANGNGNRNLIEQRNPAERKMDRDLALLSRIMNNLRTLTPVVFNGLINGDFIVEICTALSRNPHIKKVRFEDCIMNRDALKLLSENKSIIELRLNSCGLDENDAKIISKSTSIKHLELANNQICTEGAVALAKNKKTLIYLDLSNNDIMDSGLLAYITHPTIKFLILDNNKITSKGTVGIEHNNALYHLSLENNKIGDDGFANILMCKSIVKLNLRRTGITDKGAERVGYEARAACVSLGLNDIKSEGLKSLLNSKYIAEICLESNLLGSDDAKSLSKNPFLVSVNLEGNYVGSYNGVRALSDNNRLTYCKVANSSIIRSYHNTFPTFVERVNWSVWHAASTSGPSNCNYLTPKIEMNKKLSAELAEFCLKVDDVEKAEAAGRFMNDKGILPYGKYFNSLLKGSPSVLHLSVEKKNITLLEIMTKILPHSLLYFRGEGYDGLTYEEYAEKIGFEVPENLKSHEIDLAKDSELESKGLMSYGIMLSDQLTQMKIGAAGRANGLSGEDHTIFQIIGLEPTAGKAIAAFLRKLYNNNKKADPTKVFSWLRDDYDLKKLVDELKRAQFDANGVLKNETDPGNLEFFKINMVIMDAEGRQGRTLNRAEKRAVLDIQKLYQFMSSAENNPHAPRDVWLVKLMKAVMGAHHNYSHPAPQETRGELNEQLKETKRELKDQTIALNKAKAAEKDKEDKLQIEKKKVKEHEDAIAKLQNTISKLKHEIEVERLKYKSLETKSQADNKASDLQIEKLTDDLEAHKAALNDLYSICQPSPDTSGATSSTLFMGRDRRNSASHSTLPTQVPNVALQTGALSHAKF